MKRFLIVAVVILISSNLHAQYIRGGANIGTTKGIGTGFYSSIGLEIKPEKTFSGAIELGYLTRPYQKLTNMKYVTFSPMASYNVPDASFKIGPGVNLPTQDGFDTKAIVKAGFEYRIWTFFGIDE